MATRHRFDRLLQIGVDVGVVEDRLRVHPDVGVDDEFQSRQADAGVRDLREVEGQRRVADVHHDLDRTVRQFTALDLGDLGLEQAVVDETGVALAAHHGDERAVGQGVGRVATTDHRRDA